MRFFLPYIAADSRHSQGDRQTYRQPNSLTTLLYRMDGRFGLIKQNRLISSVYAMQKNDSFRDQHRTKLTRFGQTEERTQVARTVARQAATTPRTRLDSNINRYDRITDKDHCSFQ